MGDLDILDAESIGFDPMDLVRSLPTVLQQTGQALAKKPGDKDSGADKPDKAKAAARTEAPGIGLGWKIGGGAAAALIVLHFVRK